ISESILYFCRRHCGEKLNECDLQALRVVNFWVGDVHASLYYDERTALLRRTAMTSGRSFSRRAFVAGALAVTGATLAGCSGTIGSRRIDLANILRPQVSPHYLQMYAALPDEKFPVPAVDLSQIEPQYLRTEVEDPTGEAPGTIVVETSQRLLYL